MIIIQITVNEKFNELEDVASSGIFSVQTFSIVTVCCFFVKVYHLQFEQMDMILWSSLALYVSIPLDQSIRALRKLKHSQN